MLKNETVIRVRYKETDQMGVVYHANYLVWFEVGRTELMRNIGLPYLEYEKNGLYLPVTKVTCEYKAPAKYDDEVTVISRMESLSKTRLVFAYEFFRGTKILARGRTEHAFVTFEGRPVALPKHSLDLWERLCLAAGTKP
jgi:acyl-CoA thioester hydrolase